jgi:hypothetical protein
MTEIKQNKIKKTKKRKRLWQLGGGGSFILYYELDDTSKWVFPSWDNFINEEPWNCNMTYGSPLVHWEWVLPLNETEVWYDMTEEMKKEEMIDAANEDNRFTDHIMFVFWRFNGIMVFKIKVTRDDEPKIRKFIKQKYTTPF